MTIKLIKITISRLKNVILSENKNKRKLNLTFAKYIFKRYRINS
jgi:hypothetical protein